MDSIKFSFIIPAYNAEKTIKRTLDSIACRMDCYEAIVVENGSTDNTTAVVEDLIRSNSKIKLIHSDKGVSKARNEGIKQASGEWISFVDADDEWIGSQKEVSNVLTGKETPDIVAFAYEKGKKTITHYYIETEDAVSGEDLVEVTARMLAKPTLWMQVWAKLYRREFLLENDLQLDTRLRLSEDSEFLIRCLLRSKKVLISDLPVYRYCTDAPSTMRSIDSHRTEGYILSLETIKEDVADADRRIASSFTDYALSQINLICVHDIFNCDMKASWKKRIEKTKEVVNQPGISAEISKVDHKRLKDIHSLPAFFFKHGMISAGGLICYARSLMNKRAYKHQ